MKGTLLTMDKKSKIAIGTIVILAITVGAVTFAKGHINFKDGQFIDEYGWKHGASSTNGNYITDENLNRTYALIEFDKNKMDRMDAHSFIKELTPILNAYKGGQWYYTTFVFGDGTGLYFPASDINEPATYGEINEEGIVVQMYGTVSVSGTNVTYKEPGAVYSAESKDLRSYLPEEYVSDALDAWISDNNVYIIYGDTANEMSEDGVLIMKDMTPDMGKESVETFFTSMKNNGCPYFDTAENIYILIDGPFLAYSVTPDGVASYQEGLADDITAIYEVETDM